MRSIKCPYYFVEKKEQCFKEINIQSDIHELLFGFRNREYNITKKLLKTNNTTILTWWNVREGRKKIHQFTYGPSNAPLKKMRFYDLNCVCNRKCPFMWATAIHLRWFVYKKEVLENPITPWYRKETYQFRITSVDGVPRLVIENKYGVLPLPYYEKVDDFFLNLRRAAAMLPVIAKEKGLISKDYMNLKPFQQFNKKVGIKDNAILDWSDERWSFPEPVIEQCPKCLSTEVFKKGFRKSEAGKHKKIGQKMQCRKCGKNYTKNDAKKQEKPPSLENEKRALEDPLASVSGDVTKIELSSSKHENREIQKSPPVRTG